MAKLSQKIDNKIIVKFRKEYKLPYITISMSNDTYTREERKEFNQFFFDDWKELKDKNIDIDLFPLFNRTPLVEIKALVKKAITIDPTYEPVDFSKYYYLPTNTRDNKDLLDILKKSKLFEKVYVEKNTEVATQVTPYDEAEFANQGYLNPAPIGVNAEAAWNLLSSDGTDGGGDGTGITIIDIEHGWNFVHEDLKTNDGTLISGYNKQNQEHGTNTLGVISAMDNGLGCIGLAPECNIHAVSVWDNDTTTIVNPSAAIIFAVNYLNYGDIILFEIQSGNRTPVEESDACFDAIRLGTALGIIIVEPAGNGNYDLDTYLNYDGNPIFNKTSSYFRDSGAIMVGGANSNNRSRVGAVNNGDGSCFGNRLNCFSWYNNITTTSETGYTNRFNGTSGASAIIAGVTTSLQGIIYKQLNRKYNSIQMRRLLSNPLLGTASDSIRDKVNTMPDLALIIPQILNRNVDLYIRDNIDDNGDRYAGAISVSPDIITIPNRVTNAQLVFGEGSGTEFRNDLGNSIQGGIDNYIYVRLLNRGTIAVRNVTVSVYYSEVATLVTPDSWILIGTKNILTVPPNNELTVTEIPIVWDRNVIPAAGHYCYVGIIGNADDPAPPLAALNLINMSNFSDLIRENNNITWRNFNVTEIDIATPRPILLPFSLRGAANSNAIFNFRFINTLPENTQIQFIFPEELKIIIQREDIDFEIHETSGQFFINLDDTNYFELNNLDLAEGFKASCKFKITYSDATETTVDEPISHHLSITQHYKDNIVGKITWNLKTPERGSY